MNKIRKMLIVFSAGGHSEVKLLYCMAYGNISYKMWLIFRNEKRIENNLWSFLNSHRNHKQHSIGKEFIFKNKQKNVLFFYIIHLYFRSSWFSLQNQCSISSFHLSNEFVWNRCQCNWCWWVLDNNSITWWFWLTCQWNPFALFFGILQ